MWRFGIAIALLVFLIVTIAGLLFDRQDASGLVRRLSSRTSWYPIQTQDPLYANRSTLVDSRVSGLPGSARQFVEPGADWAADVRKSLSAADGAAAGSRTAPAHGRADNASMGRLDSLWPGGSPLADPDPDVAAPGEGQGSRSKATSAEPGSSVSGKATGAIPTEPGKTSAAFDRQIADAQRKLAALGYDPGPADGRAGARTQTAVRAFQRDAQVPADGRIDGPLMGRLDAETRVRSNMRQQELEAMAPAPAARSPRGRSVFGSVLGSFQRIIGRDFNSVQRPGEITAYCRGNTDSWIYDFGREAFVYCGNVITGAVVGHSASAAAGDRAANR